VAVGAVEHVLERDGALAVLGHIVLLQIQRLQCPVDLRHVFVYQ
jgi:hypothetical protein